VLMICDPRLTDKPYGRRIWQSLPPMRRTREEADAVAFLRTSELTTPTLTAFAAPRGGASLPWDGPAGG